MPPTHGVILLGNDGVRDWLAPMLASLRSVEPTLPVALIPYDSRLEHTRPVLDRYDVELIDDAHLEQLDRLGQRYSSPTSPRQHLFRKLAAFWGPYERFCFLDSDLVVTRGLQPILAGLDATSIDLAFADSDIKGVYPPGQLCDAMVERGARGWNSGVFANRTGLVEPGDVESLAAAAEVHRAELTRWGAEMSFLNFVGDSLGWRTARWSELDPGAAHSAWARQRVHSTPEGLRPDLDGRPDPGRRIVAMHWAGFRPSPLMPNARLYLRWRLRTLSASERVVYLAVRWPWAAIRTALARLNGRYVARRRRGAIGNQP